MSNLTRFLIMLLAGAPLISFAGAQTVEEPVTFRSDVSLIRVDVQVLDRDNRSVTGLRLEDFTLRENGQRREIRNFASEDMPVDVLFLLDVSASMKPHVQRIANAARQALRVMSDKDRVGIMVFDRATRVRLPFRLIKDDVEHEFQDILRRENFRGGTDITRGMMDATEYIGRQGRKDARRAIVILTDDQTEFERDDERVERALDKADTVMSALIAPDATGQMSRGGGMGGRGGGFPGGGGGRRGMGGINLPGIGGYPQGGGSQGGGYPQGGGGPRTKSAGTSEIAEQSGGDSFRVDEASALENTLSRIRQRYALYYQSPDGATAVQGRDVQISLASGALRRYPSAEVRYRRSSGGNGGGNRTDDDRPTIRRQPDSVSDSSRPDSSSPQTSGSQSSNGDGQTSPQGRRRPAVSGPGGGSGPLIPNADASATDAPPVKPIKPNQ